jgi:hypothetical protein
MGDCPSCTAWKYGSGLSRRVVDILPSTLPAGTASATTTEKVLVHAACEPARRWRVLVQTAPPPLRRRCYSPAPVPTGRERPPRLSPGLDGPGFAAGPAVPPRRVPFAVDFFDFFWREVVCYDGTPCSGIRSNRGGCCWVVVRVIRLNRGASAMEWRSLLPLLLAKKAFPIPHRCFSMSASRHTDRSWCKKVGMLSAVPYVFCQKGYHCRPRYCQENAQRPV